MEQWVLEIAGQFETFGSETELLNRFRELMVHQLRGANLDQAKVRSGGQSYDIDIDVRLMKQG